MTKILHKDLKIQHAKALDDIENLRKRNEELRLMFDERETLLKAKDALLADANDRIDSLVAGQNAMVKVVNADKPPVQAQSVYFFGPCNVAVGSGSAQNGHGAGSSIAAVKVE